MQILKYLNYYTNSLHRVLAQLIAVTPTEHPEWLYMKFG